MTAQVRKEILKELPVGSVVIYHGPSILFRRALKKIYDRSDYMRVTDGKEEYRLKYYNLTCEQIQTAQKVADKLNGDPDPDSLPF